MDIERILSLLHLVCLLCGISAIAAAAAGVVSVVHTPPKKLKEQIHAIKNPPPQKPVKRIVTSIVTAAETEQMQVFLKELAMEAPKGWISQQTSQEREA